MGCALLIRHLGLQCHLRGRPLCEVREHSLYSLLLLFDFALTANIESRKRPMKDPSCLNTTFNL
jgi:hypothetical protein